MNQCVSIVCEFVLVIAKLNRYAIEQFVKITKYLLRDYTLY